jgi:hypothetical protein
LNGFPNQMFTIKENLVIMNNFYSKVAVASLCIALTFTWGANKEANAATFTLTDTRFVIEGNSYTGVGERVLDSDDPSSEVNSLQRSASSTLERRAFYEFNISNLSLAPNTIISRAFFNVQAMTFRPSFRYLFLDTLGYVGNGRPDLSDFEAGVKLGDFPFFNLDVTQFVQQRVSNGDAFAGFGIRISTRFGEQFGGTAGLGNSADLNIETEPVPEPTTIFGSALALGVGGWLKRKKSSQQNKTTSQH